MDWTVEAGSPVRGGEDRSAFPPLRRPVLEDPSWRHSEATTADWFDPLPNAVRSADVRRARRRAPVVGTVRGEHHQVLDTSSVDRGRPLLWGVETFIAYDVRAFTVDGVPVRDYTVKLRLDRPDGVGPLYRTGVRRAVDAIFNRGYRLPGGEQFHVTVEFVSDPLDAHADIRVGGVRRATQDHWPEHLNPVTAAHELFHYLGVDDDHTDHGRTQPSSPDDLRLPPGDDARSVFARRPGQGQAVDDGGIMGTPAERLLQALTGSAVRPRHLWQVQNRENALTNLRDRPLVPGPRQATRWFVRPHEPEDDTPPPDYVMREQAWRMLEEVLSDPSTEWTHELLSRQAVLAREWVFSGSRSLQEAVYLRAARMVQWARPLTDIRVWTDVVDLAAAALAGYGDLGVAEASLRRVEPALRTAVPPDLVAGREVWTIGLFAQEADRAVQELRSLDVPTRIEDAAARRARAVVASRTSYGSLGPDRSADATEMLTHMLLRDAIERAARVVASGEAHEKVPSRLAAHLIEGIAPAVLNWIFVTHPGEQAGVVFHVDDQPEFFARLGDDEGFFDHPLPFDVRSGTWAPTPGSTAMPEAANERMRATAMRRARAIVASTSRWGAPHLGQTAGGRPAPREVSEDVVRAVAAELVRAAFHRAWLIVESGVPEQDLSEDLVQNLQAVIATRLVARAPMERDFEVWAHRLALQLGRLDYPYLITADNLAWARRVVSTFDVQSNGDVRQAAAVQAESIARFRLSHLQFTHSGTWVSSLSDVIQAELLKHRHDPRVLGEIEQHVAPLPREVLDIGFSSGAPPWTVEALERIDNSAHNLLATVDRRLSDMAWRRGRSTVLSAIGETRVSPAVPQHLAERVFDLYVKVVAAETVVHVLLGGRGTGPEFLATLIAFDLGLAGPASPRLLGSPDASEPAHFVGESLHRVEYASDEPLDPAEEAAVVSVAREVSRASEARSRQGYQPPRVRITGMAASRVTEIFHDHEVFDVDIRDEWGTAGAVEVLVDWSLRPRPVSYALATLPPAGEGRFPEREPVERLAARAARRAILDDPSWRHSQAPGADWFDPLPNAVSPERIRDVGASAPLLGTVRSERFEAFRQNASAPGRPHPIGPRIPVVYDVRDFEVDDVRVRDFYLKLHVTASDPSSDDVHEAVDEVFNRGYRLPGGEQFNLTVEFAYEAEAHATTNFAGIGLDQLAIADRIIVHLGVPPRSPVPGRPLLQPVRPEDRRFPVGDLVGPRDLWWVDRTTDQLLQPAPPLGLPPESGDVDLPEDAGGGAPDSDVDLQGSDAGSDSGFGDSGFEDSVAGDPIAGDPGAGVAGFEPAEDEEVRPISPGSWESEQDPVRSSVEDITRWTIEDLSERSATALANLFALSLPLQDVLFRRALQVVEMAGGSADVVGHEAWSYLVDIAADVILEVGDPSSAMVPMWHVVGHLYPDRRTLRAGRERPPNARVLRDFRRSQEDHYRAYPQWPAVHRRARAIVAFRTSYSPLLPVVAEDLAVLIGTMIWATIEEEAVAIVSSGVKEAFPPQKRERLVEAVAAGVIDRMVLDDAAADDDGDGDEPRVLAEWLPPFPDDPAEMKALTDKAITSLEDVPVRLQEAARERVAESLGVVGATPEGAAAVLAASVARSAIEQARDIVDTGTPDEFQDDPLARPPVDDEEFWALVNDVRTGLVAGLATEDFTNDTYLPIEMMAHRVVLHEGLQAFALPSFRPDEVARAVDLLSGVPARWRERSRANAILEFRMGNVEASWPRRWNAATILAARRVGGLPIGEAFSDLVLHGVRVGQRPWSARSLRDAAQRFTDMWAALGGRGPALASAAARADSMVRALTGGARTSPVVPTYGADDVLHDFRQVVLTGLLVDAATGGGGGGPEFLARQIALDLGLLAEARRHNGADRSPAADFTLERAYHDLSPQGSLPEERRAEIRAFVAELEQQQAARQASGYLRAPVRVVGEAAHRVAEIFAEFDVDVRS
ncbi:hypothetical protein AB0G02_21430, partial [Actinosynnema sp. NPDC023658]|uniref:hypothetical protein n=1 Tax=Actinosynnema sp. NPDC023658 TaxID=3155465 RepID=UPI0033C791CA